MGRKKKNRRKRERQREDGENQVPRTYDYGLPRRLREKWVRNNIL